MPAGLAVPDPSWLSAPHSRVLQGGEAGGQPGRLPGPPAQRSTQLLVLGMTPTSHSDLQTQGHH